MNTHDNCRYRPLRVRLRRTLLTAAVVLMGMRSASAATLYWDGSGTGWNSASSWSTANNATTPNPGAPPASGDDAVFNITTVNTAQTVNLNAAQAANSLTFNSTGTVLIQTGTGTNTLSLGAGGITVNSGAGADTISANVALSAAQVWTNSSSNLLTVSGAVNNNSHLLTVTGSGNTTISGILSGSGGVAKSGAGTFRFTGASANNYSGGTAVSGGALEITNENQLGSNVVGNVLNLNNGGALQLASGTVTIDDSNRTITVGPTGGGTFSAIGTAVLTVAVPISGNTGIGKANNGTVVLTSANNTFAGNTNVNAGKLELSGGANRLPTTTNVTVGNSSNNNYGALQIDGVSQTVAGLARAGTGAGFYSGTSRVVGGSASTATLVVNLASGTSTYTGQLGGSLTNENNLGLTKSGAGTLQLVTGSAAGQNGATGTTYSDNSYTGPTLITGGVLSVSTLANIGSNSDIGRGDSTNAATNAASLVLNGGTLRYEQYSGLGAGAVSTTRLFSVGTAGGTIESSGVGGISFTNSSTMGFNGQSGARTLTLDGANTLFNTMNVLIADNGGATTLVKNGTNSWGLSNTGNTFTGKTIINRGLVQIFNEQVLGSNPASFTADQITIDNSGGFGTNGATLQFNTTGNAVVINDSNRGITLLGNAIIDVNSTNFTATISNVITGASGSLAKNSGGTLILTAANTYGGATGINNGKIELGVNANVLPTTTVVTVGNNGNNNGGILQLNGVSQQIAGLLRSGTGAGNGVTSRVVGGSATQSTLIVNKASGASTYDGVLGGVLTNENNLAFTKAGAGSFTLDSVNTYTGATNVAAGKLIISSTGSINGTSSVTVAAGGTLLYNNATTALNPTLTLNGASLASRAVLGGSGKIGSAVALNNLGDTLSPGNSPGVLTFDVGQSWSSFSYDWEVNDFLGTVAGTDFDQIAITGGLTLSLSGSYQLNLLSLTAGNVAGFVDNFSETDWSWTILTTTTGINNFDDSLWTINTAGFSSSPAYQGTFTLTQSGNNLLLNYLHGQTLVPEPSSLLLSGLAILVGFGGLLRRQSGKHRRPSSPRAPFSFME